MAPTDLLRPRRARRSTSSTSRACAPPPRTRVRRRPRRRRPPTAPRSAIRRCASGSPSSTASTPEQVIVTNGSMQADAFLFDALVEHGDDVVVERPTYDRTLLSLRNRGADVRTVELEPDGIDVAALERAARRAAPAEARPHHPQLPEPRRLHALGGQARAAARARPQPRLHDLRGRPVRRAALRGRAAADDALDGRLSTVVYASLVLEDRLSRDPRRLPGRPDRADRPDRASSRPTPTSRRTWSPRRSSTSSAARARSTARSRPSRRRCASARRRSARRCARELPDARFVAPEGGYFLWVELPEGTDVGALFAAAAERGVQFVKGTDFLLEGGENALRLAYSGVTPERDRRGRRPPGRGLRARRRCRRHRAEASCPAARAARLSGRSGRGRARAARAARCAAAATGRRPPRRSRRRCAVTRCAVRRRWTTDTCLVVVGGRSSPSRPGLDARVLEVVEQVLGLVLEAQDRDLGARLAVGQRDAARSARRP